MKNEWQGTSAATRIDPGMPNFVGNEAEFVAAVEIGLADIKAGRTVSLEDVTAELRRAYASE